MTDLTSLSLFPATPEQLLVSRKRTYLQWGRGLSEEQYLGRDAILDTQEHASDGKLVTWVLVERDNRESLEFKCSCETYRRVGLFVRKNHIGRDTSVLGSGPGAQNDAPEPEEAACYGVASVYTPPKNRGKGYARHMMRLIHWVTAARADLPEFPKEWGAPPPEVKGAGNARFSVLYSDVGEDFYSECGPEKTLGGGWVVRGKKLTVWQVGAIGNEGLGETRGWNWLDRDGVEELWKKDAELMRQDLIEAAGDPQSKRVLFTYLPDRGVGGFLMQRPTFYFRSMTTVNPLKHWGIFLGPTKGGTVDSAGQPESRTFATWTADVRPPPETLVVTRIRATKQTFPMLLGKITETALQNGFAQVEVWNIPGELDDIAQQLAGAKTTERDEHLPAFKWYGQEGPEEVEWMFNEKFCWC